MLNILKIVLFLRPQINLTMNINVSKKMISSKEGVQTLYFSNAKAVNWNVKRRFR